MSAGQQAAIVASAQDWAAAQSHGGSRRGDQAATLPLETVAQRAAESGAPGTISSNLNIRRGSAVLRCHFAAYRQEGRQETARLRCQLENGLPVGNDLRNRVRD